MSEERIAALEERIERALTSGGAQVTVQDPRVSQVQNWILGAVGGGIIIVIGWLANSVDNLNRNFSALSEWRISTDRRIENLELERRRGP
jgi:hypothetical protein